MAYALLTTNYGTSFANAPALLLDSVTGQPAIILSSATGGLVNDQGKATLDSSGVLSVYVDTARTWSVTLTDKTPAYRNFVTAEFEPGSTTPALKAGTSEVFSSSQVAEIKGAAVGEWLVTAATLPAASPSNSGAFFLVADENGGTLYRSNGASQVKQSPGKSEYDVQSTLWADRGVGYVGQVKRILDFGNNPLVEAQWNGTRWTPRGGRQMIYDLAAPVVSASNTTQVCTIPTVVLPGGSWGLSGGFEIELAWELGAGTPLTRVLTMAFDGSNLADDSTTLHRRLALRRTIKNQGAANAQQVLERAGDYATYQTVNTTGQQKTKNTATDLPITGSITSTYGSATTAVIPFYRIWWVGQGA